MAVESPRQQGVSFKTGTNGNPIVPTVGFLRVKSNELLDEEARLKLKSEELLEDPSANGSFAQLIESRFKQAENAKDHVTDILMDALRRRKGVYSASHLAEIRRQGGSEIYMKVTETKCNAAESWIADVVTPIQGKPWGMDPTPRPELPPQVTESVVMQTLAEFEERGLEGSEDEIREVAAGLRDDAWRKIREEAKTRAGRMENLIDDEFIEGQLPAALDNGISDLVTEGTMIVKGPFIQMEKGLDWLEERDWFPNVTELPAMKFKRVDPLNFFPSPGATTIEDATYLIERDEFTRGALSRMRGVEGYNDALIEKILRSNLQGTTVPLRTDSEQATLEDRQGSHKLENPDDKYQALWYCGTCPGWVLEEWGITGLDEYTDYECVGLKVGGYVIHARLNPDPLGKRNYHKAVYKPVKGSFWGNGVPRLMNDTQDACNSTARHLINNLSIGSGPQVVIRDVDAQAEGEDLESMYPWKIWQFNEPARTAAKPIDFFQPEIHVEQLLKVFEFFLKMADDETGIPKYEYGSAQGTGAAKTATGLSMLMNSASRVLKKSIAGIDSQIIQPIVHQAFVWNMLYIDDPSIKGDVNIQASGAMGIFVKEQQQLRLQEMLTTTANAEDREIIGPTGRAALLRAGMKGLEVAVDKVVPEDEDIKERLRAAAEAQMPPGGPETGAPVPAVPGVQ